MATKGNTQLSKGIPATRDAFVVIVKTEWNAHIISKLEAGVRKVLKAQGVQYKTLTVPGAFEIPFAVKNHYAYSKTPPDAYITLGTVIRGDTPHFDYVCKAVTDGVLQLNLTLDVPVIFGVLTLENEQQALDRTGGKHGHKGEEAAVTALKMIALNRKLK
ncbi:MAG: 6,7-dimethyl-8-ribityllumazine synthase [Chitinophagaceae bacterium]|jgi:6,7-dimethyl-8-ribityllumazine synthase|nr:6,7-dimethyl-8-ribityllumazine synthase [Chitinophagaceae bacterium]